ncbi:MAG: multicopper oxidase domain-containing protein [Bdellovibrionales bacterium]|nr:multicopper oxidase domain-containing protein [Bdellovibrionales bacterium]
MPAPVLEFTDGDDAEILVTNNIPHQELSIHWHGILLPPDMDGVPYVNTPPIKSGTSHLFKFKLRQNGTYWYHSHTGVQEQKGIYGGIVIHPKKKTIKVDKEVVVVLSDWSDENADQILKNLRKDGDYYLYKKDTMRSYVGSIRQNSLGNYLYNEWTRMGGMDLSDVGYDAFLINGKRDSQLLMAHPGERIRIRIINAAASSYFYISLGQAPLKIISADGVDVEPIEAKEFLIGMAETYDILFTVPEHKNFELRATAQDGTGFASGWIGMGEKVFAPDRSMPDPYATMEHGSHGGHMVKVAEAEGHNSHKNYGDKSKPEVSPGHDPHKHHEGLKTAKLEIRGKVVESLTVNDLKAPAETAFAKPGATYDVKLVLDGDMARYIWYINGKAIHQDRNIEIKTNDVVRFTFVNQTMMHHPIHLHGHFFRVINQHDKRSPMKHTVDVPPHETQVIEFMANEPGEWMLHCHNLYHLKTGMARVVRYSSFTPKPEIAKWQGLDPHLHDHWYSYSTLETSSNHGEAYLRWSQTWNQFEARVETANIARKQFSFDKSWDYEVDVFYRRWFNRFFNVVVGGVSYGEKEFAVTGFEYMLPFLVRTNWLIDHDGKFRLDVDKRFQWTKTVFTDVDFTWRPDRTEGAHETEIEISLMYSPRWSWAAGLMLTNDSLGGGLEIQF